MSILITGCSGFAGSNIARYLANSGEDIIGLYRNANSSFLDTVSSVVRLKLMQGDLAQISELDVSADENIDMIIHIASTSPQPEGNVSQMMHDNIFAMSKLIDWAISRGCKKFIYFSSMSAFGEIHVPVVNETLAVLNPDPYGLSKRAAEQLLADVKEQMPSLSLRLPGILGVGAHRNWVSNAKKKLVKGEKVTVFHPDAPFNNAVHVDDLARFMLHLKATPLTETDFIITGANGNVTVLEAVLTMKAAIASKSKIETTSLAKTTSFTLDSQKAMDVFGYDPMHIKDMLTQFIQE